MVISIYVFSFWGFAPRPPPGLCSWTPLGDFCLQSPCFVPPPKQISDYAPADLITIQAAVGYCHQMSMKYKYLTKLYRLVTYCMFNRHM